ncbi:bifunctional phosphopantothenoylcysteine decarboxylase/phosphopantothenate--cysteine ligase CoaBC [candidate division KSB1 bacterium]|nr:bifunctional phosphopantothenoylcysteine decarboxylase/phosphopantothenate--cysteine ligase CoaBC [candidate division KSB1 bacterium]NIR72264.1 bifunctional phosphopantothenoylcysteine decarboxylase/phosphopantothenate--cysteine ligase CoaBC [candidate division KSB1 bacterium]NIS24235.1 bifunctional phosphopantothenoylcysteine decarboxylase/phosphopantothenate--cysteine ligase CoaBC [candidate division KSB1 bacterium]NIT71149.1 bifunctional phosphopantothenoylcysteine decarboxylase/phosphopan
MLDAKKIAVGVTGGIAAYKTCEIIRDVKKLGAEVRVSMTESAKNFVTELTFTSLSENPVICSLFDGHETRGISHIDLARWCDLFLVCPATANIIGKVAAGLADDFLSTTIMATESPVVFCPAMNSSMWTNPLVQENVLKLKRQGYRFVEPDWGTLATTAEGEGWGRLASVKRILHNIKYTLLGTSELENKRVLVTAGPTRESMDPVRFISNHSSGKMGFALAEAAKLRSAAVTLIAGPNHLDVPDGVKYQRITSVEDLKDAIYEEYDQTHILIMAAAVSDYRPKTRLSHKLKKSSHEHRLDLERTTDILAELGKKKEGRIHVGFALETENGVAEATKKLHAKNLDMVVLNNPLEPGAAFDADTNIVTIISTDREPENLPKLTKDAVAGVILDRICERVKHNYQKAAAV